MLIKSKHATKKYQYIWEEPQNLNRVECELENSTNWDLSRQLILKILLKESCYVLFSIVSQNIGMDHTTQSTDAPCKQNIYTVQ